MEAIKNFLKPGSKDDDQTLYDAGSDPNRGKVAGEGSHFGHGYTDSGVGGVSSPTTTVPTGSSATNPVAGVTGSSATKTSEPTSTTGTSQVPIGTASTTDERAFPLSNTGTGVTSDPSSQTGSTDRTAAGTVPAAAGTTAAAAAQPTTSSTQQTTSTSAIPATAGTSTLQQGSAPHSPISSSNADTIYSPAQPADDKCMDTLHGGPHETLIARKIDPCYDETPGAAGTSGLSSTTSQPSVTSASRSEALAPGVGAATGAGAGAATAGATGSSATNTAGPLAGTSTQRSVDPETSNTGSSYSNAAVPAAVGAGAGLAGASAAGSHHTSGQTSAENHAGRPSASTATTVPTTANSGVAGTSAGTAAGVAHPYSEKAVDPRIDSGNNASTTSQYKTLDPAVDQRAAPTTHDQGHHYGRDAAIGGAAGAGALADHEYSKKEAENAVKQQKELEKQHEKAEKEHEKDIKHHNKEVEKEQKQHEKEVEKAEKKHEKEAEKEQKQHEKAIAKEEKQHEKEVKQHEKELEKERKKQEKAEKPGLIDRLLHRGDSKKEDHAGEAAAAGAATGAGAGAVHEHNKLHKDPPPGYAAEPTKGYASQVTGGTGTTALAQGNENILPAGGVVGEPGTTVPGTRYGSGHNERPAVGAQPEFISDNPNQGLRRESIAIAGGTVQSTTPYVAPPAHGYASQVTGGTGTTQLAEGNRDPVTNPTKSDPLREGPTGYASQVTGGTGTTELAQGTQTVIPTHDMQPGRSGSVAGVTTETPYVDGPKAGTGKYADQVTGGTGTTQLAQGQLDEVAQPRGKSIADKVEEALVLK